MVVGGGGPRCHAITGSHASTAVPRLWPCVFAASRPVVSADVPVTVCRFWVSNGSLLARGCRAQGEALVQAGGGVEGERRAAALFSRMRRSACRPSLLMLDAQQCEGVVDALLQDFVGEPPIGQGP